MPGKMLYNPKAINRAFAQEFGRRRSWTPVRIQTRIEVPFVPKLDAREKARHQAVHRGFREMDFVKNYLGVEVQFGKYAFMVYNVLAKMTIFSKMGHINAGVEIVPMHLMTREMSTGVSYFEQFVSDLEARGVGA